MLTPSEMQQAMQEFMQRKAGVESQWEVSPIKSVETSMANNGFVPVQQPQYEQQPSVPQFNVVPLPDDLKAVLVESVSNRQMELFTPENVFLQQVLREVKELRKVVDLLYSQLLQNGNVKEVIVPQTKEQNRLLPRSLVFQEPEQQQQEVAKNGKDQKPKPVRKGRRSAKS
jgi:hypothetical protein